VRPDRSPLPRTGEGVAKRRVRAEARLLLAAVTTLLAGACSKCGANNETAVPLEVMLPRHSVAVVMVPRASAVGEKLKTVESLKVASFAAQLQGFTDAHQWSDALFSQLGFDVRSDAALTAAGLDPSRGLGAAMTLEGQPYLVLPVKDDAKLKDTLTRLAGARFGTTVVSDASVSGLIVHQLAAPGQPPRFGWVSTKSWVLVATEAGVARLGAWASAPEGGGLATDPALKQALARLPPTRDVIVYVPAGSPALRREISSAIVGVGLTPTGLSLDVAGEWRGDPQVLAALTAQPSNLQALGELPSDAFAVARFSGDASKLAPVADLLLGPNVSKAFSEDGFDLKSEVLGNLEPGGLAALSLAPNANLASGVPELDLKSTNPFGYAHLTGVVQARDAAKVGPALAKLAAVAPRFGATIEAKERDGHSVFLTRYSAGEGVHFAAVGPRVYFGSPLPRLDALLASDGKGAGPLADPALRTALQAHTAAVVIDLRRLADSVRALPASAWGIGGFAIKQTTLRWLDATDDLTAVTAGLDAKDGAVAAQLLLSLKPAAPVADGGASP